MPSAKVTSLGKVVRLDARAQPTRALTSSDVQDHEVLATELSALREDVAEASRRANPRRIDFEDIVVDATGTTKYRFPHRFNGRVRFWPVDYTSGTVAPCLKRHADTDTNTLVVTSTVACTVTVRVEEAG